MLYDAIIIGGSFAGLSAAMQLARGRRSVCVIDTGLPRNRFTDASHGFFAHDGDAPLSLIAKGRAKVAEYPNVRFVRGEAVRVAGQTPKFSVALANGATVEGARLVLAFGVKDGLPDIEGVSERWGHTVLHCPYCHGYEFGGQPLGVLQTMPMSSHQALMIPEWGATTFFLNGGPEPDADTLSQLSRRGVTIEPSRVVALEGEAPELCGVRLEDGRLIPVSALYLGPKTELNSDVAKQLGCEIEEGPFGPVIKVDAMMQTNVPGVFAAGDIARAMHNATFASADGVMAGTAAHRSLIFADLNA